MNVKDMAQLREITRMTGLLNNVQTHQLKMWTHVILAANDGAFEFDSENCVFLVEISNLDYQGMMEGVRDDIYTHFQKRLAFYNQCVKMLIGTEYGVVVKMKGKILANFPPTSSPQKSNQDWKRIFAGANQ